MQNIVARGRTIPELTQVLEAKLATWFRRPTVVISAIEHRSAQATVLGRVNTPGVISLTGNERILDLIAQSGGLATSRFSGSTEELADLSGALYLRNGERLAVDFVALVKEGQHHYNLSVWPGDYLYIPSSISRKSTFLGRLAYPKQLAISMA